MAATVPAILKYLTNNQDYAIDQNIEVPQRAKKRRLDHLSWEEKMQRKKLKNRVAAQTSRDRKKAKMEDMEKALQQLFSQNKTLSAECDTLKLTNQRLTQENAELKNRLQEPCANCSQSRPVVCEALNGSTESLLLPKGRTTHSAAALNEQTATALSEVILTCLLYLTCLTNSTRTSTSTPWSSSRRVSSGTLPETCSQQQRIQTVRTQPLAAKTVSQKWWGRHQRSWNPVDVKC